MARALFGAMATGGLVGFKTVAWFNGGLFDDDAALPLERSEIDTTLEAAALDWSEIDPRTAGRPWCRDRHLHGRGCGRMDY